MKIIIFGEDHRDISEVKEISEKIKKIKPDYILHELLYNDICLNKKEIKNRLNNCKEGNYCDPRLNKDIYELGYEENIPLIGIDLDLKNLQKLSIRKQFEKREKNMVKKINQYKNKGTIVVVVGDTHLRDLKSKELGGVSPLIKEFFKEATIIRSKNRTVFDLTISNDLIRYVF